MRTLRVLKIVQKRYYIIQRSLRIEGNPFLEAEDIVITPIVKVILTAEAFQSVHEAKNLIQQQYKDFIHERIVTGKISVQDVIRKNKLLLFRNHSVIVTPKSKLKVNSLKQDWQLYSTLYIASQTSECNL